MTPPARRLHAGKTLFGGNDPRQEKTGSLDYSRSRGCLPHTPAAGITYEARGRIRSGQRE